MQPTMKFCCRLKPNVVRRHPAAAFDGPPDYHTRIKPENLAGHELIHLAPSTSMRQHVDLLIRDIDVRHSGLEVEHLATVAGLIGQGLGVSGVPELTLFQFRSMDLVAIPLTAASVVRPILIVQHRERPLSSAAQATLELIEPRLRAVGRMRRVIE